MKTKISLMSIMVLLVAICPNTAAQDKTLVEYRYKAGSSYRYKTLSDYEMVQEMNGKEMKMSAASTTILKMEVTEVSPEGNMSFINTYEEMKVGIKNSMMDTTMEQKDIVGKRGRVVVNKLGVEIKKEVIDTIKMQGMLTGANSLLTSGLMRLPGHPVALGEKWVNDQVDTLNIGDGNTVTRSHTEYTMVGSELKNNRECYKFSFVSRSETAGKMTQQGMEIFIEGDGDTMGWVWVDIKEAILICKESISNQDMTYAMTGQMKMSVPSTQKITLTYSLVE